MIVKEYDTRVVLQKLNHNRCSLKPLVIRKTLFLIFIFNNDNIQV